jgi:hypothetical protein
MKRDTWTQLIAGVCMLLCVGGSGAVALALSASAGRHRLAYTERVEDSTPPQVALGIAMGAFRGVFVNWLWYRANEMKEAGKFFDAVELAGAITRLQPRFPRVWVFHAWNLSYNISVATQTRTERWQWVNAGIDLLRRQGIRANPNDTLLHKELAWIFLHKVQGWTDDANQYYKRRLAEEWTNILGEPPAPTADSRTREAAIKRYADWLRPIVEAPGSIEELTQKMPEVGPLAARLRAEVTDELGADLLRRYTIARAILASSREQARLRAAPEGNTRRTRAMIAIVQDPALKPALDALIATVRRMTLAGYYNMEPERMMRYTETYGPLDWRHPAAHGLYWGARGVEVGLDRVQASNKADYDFLNTDRVVAQCVQELYRTGELYFDYMAQVRGDFALYGPGPNIHFVPTYGEIIEGMAKRGGLFEDLNQRAYTILNVGYENFLGEAVMFYYRRGQRDEADRWMTKLRTWKGANLNQGDREYNLSDVDKFVTSLIEEGATRPAIAVNQIVGALQGAFVSGMLVGDREAYQSSIEFAVMAHRYFMQAQLRRTVASGEEGRMSIVDKDFRFVAGIEFAKFIRQLPLELASKAYLFAEDDLRRYAYDLMADAFRAQLDEETKIGADGFDKLFPEPAGMDAHRAFIAQKAREREQGQEIQVEKQ